MHYQGIRHGEAVSLGMVAAFRLAIGLGRASGEEAGRLVRLLRALGLPVNLDDYFSEGTICFLGSDKKRRSGQVDHFAQPGELPVALPAGSDLRLHCLGAHLEGGFIGTKNQ